MPLVLLIVVMPIIADDPLAPWANNVHPTDVARRHVQTITDSHQEYVVVQGGTMDGRNCRSPQGVWQPFQQTWESNRSVRLENIGDTVVIDPWVSNGHNDFRNIDEIVARVIEPNMSDRDKAVALWWQEVQHRFHLDGDNNELLDPVKVFNVYGHNTCGNDSICLAGQWRRAGLRVAPARLVGHCVSQVYYGGSWHLLDGDMQSVYLLRDNETVASEQDLVLDHDLIKRTHTQGILQPDQRSGDEWESSIYVFEGEINGDRNSSVDGSMSMTLRPGESIEWRWGHVDPVKYHANRPPQFAERVCNGLWQYRPDFSRPTWRDGATSAESVVERDGGLTAESGKTSVVVWRIQSPYVFVGGKLDAESTGAQWSISSDGKAWQPTGDDLDRFFEPQGPARYAYYLKCELPGNARLDRLGIVNDLQMAPLTLPGMGIGRNVFAYSDQSTGARNVRITHQWVERSASRPPDPPMRPIYPPPVGEADGTDIEFAWTPSADPDGDQIADYQFELSARADMKWPLSMNFAKLVSRTANRGQARYRLPAPGLLNPDRKYYWHVRAQDENGVWGQWSDTWQFTPRGPAQPLNVSIKFDPSENRGTLHWEPNRLGNKPVSYRVYASDEKGFSISDEPYRVNIGTSKALPPEFPGNFVGQTEATGLAVIGFGRNVSSPIPNKAYYRVVAVDSSGKRSGPSDYAAAPRPVIYSTPVTSARVGANYQYSISAIRSLGDLRTRVIDGKEIMNFWDMERRRFAIEQGPSWLAIDEATGVLSGTPDRAGKFDAAIAVTLERDSRRLDEAALKWGIEKVVATGTEKIGSAIQRFVIDVRP